MPCDELARDLVVSGHEQLRLEDCAAHVAGAQRERGAIGGHLDTRGSRSELATRLLNELGPQRVGLAGYVASPMRPATIRVLDAVLVGEIPRRQRLPAHAP